ncbi:hypothetical protein BKA80DRAFT_255223 [Phyllosticta citrichinensis]
MTVISPTPSPSSPLTSHLSPHTSHYIHYVHYVHYVHYGIAHPEPNQHVPGQSNRLKPNLVHLSITTIATANCSSPIALFYVNPVSPPPYRLHPPLRTCTLLAAKPGPRPLGAPVAIAVKRSLCAHGAQLWLSLVDLFAPVPDECN